VNLVFVRYFDEMYVVSPPTDRHKAPEAHADQLLLTKMVGPFAIDSLAVLHF